MESPFLVKELRALLHDEESFVDLTEDIDSQSQTQSETQSQSQPANAARSFARSHTMLVKATTQTGTLILVDHQLCIEAFINDDHFSKIKSKRGFKSLSRLKGVRICINNYFYATPGYCLGKSHLQNQVDRSRSRASTVHQPGPICMWVDEFDAPVLTEMVVGAADPVEEDPQIKRLLADFPSAQLESRLIEKQQLDPAFAGFTNGPVASPSPVSTSVPTNHVVTDSIDLDDFEIPEDQQEQLNQVEGWQKTLEKTDSQLIEENGTMPETEPEESTGLLLESQGADGGDVSPSSTISDRSSSSETSKPRKTKLIRRPKPTTTPNATSAFGKENVEESFPVCDDTEDDEEAGESEEEREKPVEREASRDEIEQDKHANGLTREKTDHVLREKNQEDPHQENDGIQSMEPMTQQCVESEHIDFVQVDVENVPVGSRNEREIVNETPGEQEQLKKAPKPSTNQHEQENEPMETEDDTMWHTQAIDDESQLFPQFNSAPPDSANHPEDEVIDLVDDSESVKDASSQQHPREQHVAQRQQKTREVVREDEPAPLHPVAKSVSGKTPSKPTPKRSSPVARQNPKSPIAGGAKRNTGTSLPPTPSTSNKNQRSNRTPIPTPPPTKPKPSVSSSPLSNRPKPKPTPQREDKENERVQDNNPDSFSAPIPMPSRVGIRSTTRTVAAWSSKSVSRESLATRPSKRFKHLFPPLELHELMETLSKP